MTEQEKILQELQQTKALVQGMRDEVQRIKGVLKGLVLLVVFGVAQFFAPALSIGMLASLGYILYCLFGKVKRY